MTMTAFALALTLAAAPDQRVKFDALPQAVKTRVHETYPAAKVIDAEQEASADGGTVFEVKLLVEEVPTELSLAADGSVVLVERLIDWKRAPEKVQKAFAASAAKDFKVERVEEVSEGGTLTWELKARRADGRRVEVIIDAKGHVTFKSATE